ncbi:MAG: DUF2490 domain-containing protein [Reichenbachiella sp.]|uniref:DUF2490 domain-containing protein n=1 Tax=Reichenbachiella sp. TaxID=2184521 RepID=UPI00296729AE|nr:DUF2490 domain-containing protein [Reichenbachiella sp.]MDW3209150.1 DUF2490 domain-containing protein [Reichenbachiella sp.]
MFRSSVIWFGFYFLTCFFVPTKVEAQDSRGSGQLWLAGEVKYNTKSNFVIRGKLEYQTEYDSDDQWNSWIIGFGADYLLIPNLELNGVLQGFSTNENDTLSKRELRPVLGIKFDFINKGRFIFYNHLKFEWRQIYLSTAELNSGSLRVREQLGMTMALTQKNPSMNKSLNLLIWTEAFFVKEDKEKERFSNRVRLVCGLSYRLSDQWKIAMTYYRQRSRNQIGESFESQENILRLKATCYL